jgi:hypothetical protein
MGRNSKKEPGQPWKKTMGTASGLLEKRAVKWMLMVVVVVGESLTGTGMAVLKLGKELTRSSLLRLI